MHLSFLSTQLAVVSACFVFLVLQVVAQQSGCASNLSKLLQPPAQNSKAGAAGLQLNPAKAASARKAKLAVQSKIRRAIEPRATKQGDKVVFQPTKRIEAVAGGDGICGVYDTDKVLGVCLWSGSDQTGKDPAKSGWLSGSATQNCLKEVEFFRVSSPGKTIVAKVVDGCSFNDKELQVGCENIFVTKKLLAVLDPERKGAFGDLRWNFKDSEEIS